MNNYQKISHENVCFILRTVYYAADFWAKFMEALCRRTTIIAVAPSSGGAEGRDSTDVCHVGFNVFSASMWTGGTLGTGLSYNDFFLAVFFGNLLLGIYTAFLGYIGAKPDSPPTSLHVTPLALKAHGFPRYC